MLKGIDPLLTPDLLAALARMGHGDLLAVVDRNYPAYRCGQVVELPGHGIEPVMRAVLSVWPVDTFACPSVRHMLTDTGDESPATAQVRPIWQRTETEVVVAEEGVRRLAFYAPASTAMLTIRTGETMPYACYLLSKGVC